MGQQQVRPGQACPLLQSPGPGWGRSPERRLAQGLGEGRGEALKLAHDLAQTSVPLWAQFPHLQKWSLG